ncbi:hypothetical protein VTI74DRAFT_10852 [Chaetomium olivicolor]
MAPNTKDELSSNLTKLSLKTTELQATPASRSKPTKKSSSPVADSWEDEADDVDNDESPSAETPVAAKTNTGTSAPPPTPMSPVANTKRPFSPSALSGPGFTIPPFDGTSDYPDSPQSSSGGGPSKRPEKTDAVARRMIASALGMKAPRLTEEQRAYDKAMREKERKRREEEKEKERKREEEIAKARQAIWDD